MMIPGADSHSRAYGAYGAIGIGVGSTTLGFGWSTGYIYTTVAKPRRVRFRGALQPWVTGKTWCSSCCAAGAPSSRKGMSVEFIDQDRQPRSPSATPSAT